MKTELTELLDYLLKMIPEDITRHFAFSTHTELIILEKPDGQRCPNIKLFFHNELSKIAEDGFTSIFQTVGYLTDTKSSEKLWTDTDVCAFKIDTTAFIMHSWYQDDQQFENQMKDLLTMAIFNHIDDYNRLGCISIELTDFYS